MSTSVVERINWNEEWEKNFNPVYIQDQVQIRATFHEPKPEYPYDIIINPKMSFGTGHHETTSLIVSEQLSIDHQGKNILDVGTGTGILHPYLLEAVGKSGQVFASDFSYNIENRNLS